MSAESVQILNKNAKKHAFVVHGSCLRGSCLAPKKWIELIIPRFTKSRRYFSYFFSDSSHLHWTKWLVREPKRSDPSQSLTPISRWRLQHSRLPRLLVLYQLKMLRNNQGGSFFFSFAFLYPRRTQGKERDCSQFKTTVATTSFPGCLILGTRLL